MYQLSADRKRLNTIGIDVYMCSVEFLLGKNI